MIIDARILPANEVLETDICIVGAGPAGITLAREFMGTSYQVCLIESGGLEHDAETQALTEATVVGDPYPPLPETRKRQFGGTAHLWEAQSGYRRPGWRCLPFDPIDFEQREWIPYSGWPFDRAHLDPFYERAHQVCQIGAYTYQLSDWETKTDKALPLSQTRLMTKMSQYGSRTPFTKNYRGAIADAKNITTLLHANVTNLEVDESHQSITRLQISCLKGNQLWINARIVILAAGGIENARLLLASNRQQSVGLGNQYDVVGRFFMERPVVTCGHLRPTNPKLFDQTGLYDVREIDHYGTMAWIALQEAVIRQERLLNSGIQIFPRPQSRQTQGTRAFKKLVSTALRLKFSENIPQLIQQAVQGSDYLIAASFWAMIRRLPGLHRGDWSYLPIEKRRFSSFELIYQIEQAPDPDNRITLDDEVDALGLPKAKIHWRLNPIDIATVRRVQAILKEDFAKAGLGELHLAGDERSLQFDKLAMHHHMGATRMHIDPKQGVVNENGQVHGIHNLFITGCSVFPTAGYANPTLTMIALSLRLADHLKQKLQSVPVELPNVTAGIS